MPKTLPFGATRRADTRSVHCRARTRRGSWRRTGSATGCRRRSRGHPGHQALVDAALRVVPAALVGIGAAHDQLLAVGQRQHGRIVAVVGELGADPADAGGGIVEQHAALVVAVVEDAAGDEQRTVGAEGLGGAKAVDARHPRQGDVAGADPLRGIPDVEGAAVLGARVAARTAVGRHLAARQEAEGDGVHRPVLHGGEPRPSSARLSGQRTLPSTGSATCLTTTPNCAAWAATGIRRPGWWRREGRRRAGAGGARPWSVRSSVEAFAWAAGAVSTKRIRFVVEEAVKISDLETVTTATRSCGVLYQWPKMLTHRAIEPSRIVYAKPEA